MEKRGIVDAVWSEDGDTLMFGSKLMIRTHYKNKAGKEAGKRGGDKSTTHFQVHRVDDIARRYPGLDREGLVLHAVLNGGDYDPKGLKNFGPEASLKAAQYGLGKELCNISEAGLQQWRQKLIAYLQEVKSPAKVPDHFPNFRHINYYREPLVSKQFPNFDFFAHIDELSMRVFLQTRFNFDKNYLKWIVPMLLVRALIQTKKGQEANNRCYQIDFRQKRDRVESKATFRVSAVSILELTQNQSDTVECELPTYILEYALPDAMPKDQTRKMPLSAKKTAVVQKSIASPAGILQPTSGKKRGRPAKESVSAGSPSPV
ncbi:hypothetical protein PVAG01_04698 [Phlyctema vagabunda]|uniref:XPG-I domain-containing protein n=1 Tax=Phlyctema vagabunda TaxID=108571 RepID=A0ABR4PHZ0_9HELO